MGDILLETGGFSARISPRGAELTSLKHARVGEFLWQATDDRWRRQAPVLFPIIGRYPADMIRFGSGNLTLPPHGFAPDSEFAVEHRSRTDCRMVLRDSAATARLYPYRFRLEVEFALDAGGLTVALTLENPATDQTLPYMLGGHPGFAWPLPLAGDPRAHRLRFSHDELPAMRIITPATGRVEHGPAICTKTLDPSLLDFHGRTYVCAPIHSDTVTFGTDAIYISFTHQGFDNLALWRRDTAPFLCIEPWTNMPITADGPTEFENLRDLSRLGPGMLRRYAFRIVPGGTKLAAV